MNDTKYHSRRLWGNEIDLWVELGRISFPSSVSIDNSRYAQKLLSLDESLFFVSFLGDDPVGGSAIFKDTSRNAMALLSVRVIEEYRKRMTSHLIKSSLPFFKTVAIREVDALVETTSEYVYPFPIQTSLPSWCEEYLTEQKFEMSGKVILQTFDCPSSLTRAKIDWDSQPADRKNLRNLYWAIEERERQDYSQFWLGIELSILADGLYTHAAEERYQAVLGTLLHENHLVVPSIMYNQTSIDDNSMASNIIMLAQQNNADKISIFHLEGTQNTLIEDVSSICGTPIYHNMLTLYRKSL